MKTIYLAVLVALNAIPRFGVAQTFIEDLDRISQSNEIAKQCDALSKSGGTDDRCKSYILSTQKQSVAVTNSNEKKSIKFGSVADLADSIDVIAYSSSGSSARIDAVIDNRIHRMHVGDIAMGWKLVGLNEYEARFQSNDKAKKILVQSFRMPAASSVAGVPNGPIGYPGAAPVPAGGFPPLPMPFPSGAPANTVNR